VVGDQPRGGVMDMPTDGPSIVVFDEMPYLVEKDPTEAQARRVLEAIGSGERTFTNIARAVGDIAGASLTRALTPPGPQTDRRRRDTPVDQAREQGHPLPDHRPPPTVVAGLRGAAPRRDRTRLRGQGQPTPACLVESWRGRAVEPVVREALALLPAERLPPGCEAFGGYWTRTNDPEIDIVAADRSPIAKHVAAVGSVKWLEGAAFDHRDLAALTVHRDRLPGATADTPLIAVSRSGITAQGIHYAYGPQDLLTAWE